LEEAIREGYFQVISIITCTGFASADYLFWSNAGIFLIFILMFSGGSTGSTSGGIKMARHLIVIKNIKRIFVQLSHPNALVHLRLNGKNVDEPTNISIFSFIMLYIYIFIIGTVILTVYGSDVVTSASSVATCMAGIGPGLGSVGPMSNFSDMSSVSKLVLSLVMITGRLEIITIFTLFTKSFWKL
jgi:trk system potassium uptake protein TrkH